MNRPARQGTAFTPDLFDRLLDEEAVGLLGMSGQLRLRASVLRELSAILNTCAVGGDSSKANGPADSVLGYGLPPLAGRSVASVGSQSLEQAVRDAIVRFEPRISRASLKVHALDSDLDYGRNNVVSMRIEGELIFGPPTILLTLRTDVDLESGVVRIHDLTRGK